MKYPILEKLLREGCIQNLSVLFAEKHAQDEPTALFLAYLWNASVKGHVCIKIAQFIEPELEEWTSIESELKKKAFEMIKLGAETFSNTDEPYSLVKREGFRFYLQRNWVFESLIIEHVKRLEPNLFASPEEKLAFTEALSKHSDLLPEQKKAIETAFTSSLSLILGGPGTGKTHTAVHLIETFNSTYPSLRVMIAAPTGKAVSHLKQKIERNFSFQVEGKTLHSLLKMKKRKNKSFQSEFLPYDLILIDESSMIDIRMMAYLLHAISNHTRIVLMGDPDQLPPIESGNLFYDLSLRLKKVTMLKKPMRFDVHAIYSFSKFVQEKRFNDLTELINHDAHVNFTPLLNKSLSSQKSIKNKLDVYLSRFLEKKSIEAHLNNLQQYRILSSLRSGPFGVDALNQYCYQQIFNKSYEVAIPILITANNHVKQLYNGMHGIMLIRYQGGQKKETAYFYTEDQKTLRSLSKFQLPSFEYGFCLSVHKSQGSEFEHVLLFVPEGSQVFGGKVLYTAATRAKKSLEIVSTLEILEETITHSSIKLSGISDRI